VAQECKLPTMKTSELKALGIPNGEAIKKAIKAIKKASKSKNTTIDIPDMVKKVVQNPASYTGDPLFGKLAGSLLACQDKREPTYSARKESAPYTIWGTDFEPAAIEQLKNACALPISVRGALMPDAHVGYGLPIGGVLATKNAVIPFAVGVDIACRMKMTVLDLPVNQIERHTERLKNALSRETRFGVGAEFKQPLTHAVMDEDWKFSPIIKKVKDKAWSQLGTSGSGNHFVEFGTLTVERDDFFLKPGVYLALLSHSGSRGAGNEVARYYSNLAMQMHKNLQKELKHLAWLNTTSHEGQEYWKAMELMGRYAAANHQLIHRRIAKNLALDVLLDLENHHNFAWKENHFGEEVIVHRKGATPAGDKVLGIIPGSMATPGYVVRGKADPISLNSASHGAGRKMSRKAAKNQFNWHFAKEFLDKAQVTLMSAGIDEVPMAYKDIDTVMNAQRDLVEIMARFDPRIVKMAPGGERPED